MRRWHPLRRVRRWSSKIHTTPGERLLLFAVVVLLVIAIALEYQVQQLTPKVTDAKSAATAAQTLVDAAVNNPANAAQAQATADAIARIKRIEQAVCGGPCPDVNQSGG